MLRVPVTLSVALLSMCTLLSGSVQAGEWKSLFDGTSLKGWIQKNGTATYRVEDGAVVGKTNEGSPNSFLCSEKDYGDFELEFEVKIDSPLNSGVQIRSITAEPKNESEKFGRVNGPQVEIEAKSVSGYIYGEATGRGWLTPDDVRKPHKAFKENEWNHFRIVAQGPRIQTWVNGQQISDLTDEKAFETHPKGFIGLQVHSIASGTGPYEAAWKNIRIKTLD